MKVFIFTIICILSDYYCFAQVIIGGDTGSDFGDARRFEKWIVNQKSEYGGVYHFGFSEGESTFNLIMEGDSCYAFIKYGEFINGGHGFQWHAIPLTKVRIVGNKLFSDKTQGEFMIYDLGTRKSRGLVVFSPWRRSVDKGVSEFGFFITGSSSFFIGKYPFTSYRILSESELSGMNPGDLRIMRNEIYARLGYKFTPEGDMDKYFRNQDWYKPRYDNVDNSMTEIDKRNIQSISKTEKLLKGL